MKTTTTIRTPAAGLVAAAVLALAATAARAQRYTVEYYYGRPIAVEITYPGYCPPPVYPVAPERTEYQPHLAADYRAGYWAGRRDAGMGFGRNSRGAFLASGCRWESYFQEGYADGYEGRPMNH